MKDKEFDCFFREQARYTQTEIGKKLLGKEITNEPLTETEEKRIVALIKRLKEFGVIKRVKKDAVDLQEIDNDDYSVAPVVLGDTESLYAFCFVGVLWVNEFIIKCYPKYIRNNETPVGDFKEVLQVIKHYNHKKENVIHLQNDGLESSAFNMLALMLYFLNDYYQNGIYSNAQEIIETNGTGEILWDKTINETFAYIQNNRPFYMELKTRKRINDETGFFSRLHQCILSECSRKLEGKGLFDIFDDIAPIEFDESTLEDFGDREYLSYRIERELGVQYNSRKRLLLQSMYAYINNEKSVDTNEHFSMFGTTAYHTIWEDVCKKVLCDMLGEPIKSVFKSYVGGETFKEHIKKPTWNGIEAKDTLIPDIVTFYNYNGQNAFAIFDAKYYDVQIGNNSISGQPGIESITKQYLYELAYKDLIPDVWGNPNPIKVYNAFIFPSETVTKENGVERKGDVEFSIMKRLNLQKIKIVFVNPKSFYDKYLAGETALEDIVKQITPQN